MASLETPRASAASRTLYRCWFDRPNYRLDLIQYIGQTRVSDRESDEGAGGLCPGYPTPDGGDYLLAEVFEVTVHAAMLSSVQLPGNVRLFLRVLA